jgi:hypothetical protein
MAQETRPQEGGMQLRLPLLAVALAAGLALPARADVNVYYHVGVWDAFDGQGDNGQPLCGIGSRNASDGRAFSLRFPIGGDDVTFTATKPGWNIPNNTQIPVVVQIGLQQPWTEQAVGSGNRVEWTLDRSDIQTFDAQFRRATSMTVTFPSGNEPPWVISLSGSTAASNAMGRCVTDLTRRANAAAPAATSAPANQTATQPFAAAPAEQGSAAPAAQGNAAPAAQGNPAPAAPGNPAPAQPATQDQQTQPNAPTK